MSRLMLVLAALLLGGSGAVTHDRCAALREVRFLNLDVEAAQLIAGSFKAPDGSVIDTLPACRIRGVSRPTPFSRIAFELWLPRNGWNGRYYQLGNGGFAGNIHFPSLAAEVARGNAAASTDTGHIGNAFDASWAAGSPDIIVDYGYRSIKATSDAAHRFIQAYYGRAAHHRYFAGCSNGGRQALMAAQRYPEDWDGILAGAPAVNWTRHLQTFASLQHRLRSDLAAWIPAAKLPAIQRTALASCPLRSVAGGVAIEPPLCRFDPREMICRGIERRDCLTGGQAESLRRISAAGFEPTSAALPDNWERWILNPDLEKSSHLTFAHQAFRHLLQKRPDWQLRDWPSTPAPSPTIRSVLDAASTDYQVFRSRGGRILSYFGWADAVIPPREGLAYYERVAAHSGGMGPTRRFYRLFMVPGMTHCQGGVGPVSFGQSLAAPAALPDRRHDVRAALEAWVEAQIAPDRVIAAELGDGRGLGSTTQVRVIRPR